MTGAGAACGPAWLRTWTTPTRSVFSAFFSRRRRKGNAIKLVCVWILGTLGIGGKVETPVFLRSGLGIRRFWELSFSPSSHTKIGRQRTWEIFIYLNSLSGVLILVWGREGEGDLPNALDTHG